MPQHPFAQIGGRIADLRRALGRSAGRRVTQREMAEALGVHLGTVTAWEIGKQRPEGENLDRLAELLDVSPDYLLHGTESERGGDELELGEIEPMAVELFGSFDRLVRYMEGIGPPGQARLAKLDALEGLRRLLTARGALPEWWHRLRDRIESGRL